MKANRALVASAGPDKGMTIVAKVRKYPAPSMRAESSRSRGMERKNCRKRKVRRALERKGTVSAA